jgi:signal transduction histidine kinase
MTQARYKQTTALPESATPGFYPQSVIDCLPCYITIQNRDLKIIYANQTFLNDFGDGVGKTCHFVYKGCLDRCKICPVQETFNDKKYHISEETVQTLDGKICRLIVHSAPLLDNKGNVAAVIEQSTNITNVKEMQKELASLGQSIALMSHGIKNILEGLQGGAYVVDEGIKDNDMRLARQGWEIVKKNIHDITTVSQNILFASKRRPLRMEKASAGDIVSDSVDLFKTRAAAQHITLTHRVNPDLPLVRMDPFAIRRMLINFMSNSLEACSRGSADRPHAITVSVDYYDDDHVVFEVSDTGIGMNETVRANIFNEFFSTKGSRGTGLGLAIVKKIVRAHAGTIDVTSTPGRGSTFRVVIRAD